MTHPRAWNLARAAAAALLLAQSTVGVAGAGGARALRYLARAETSPILAGAATVNITPFTLTKELRACRKDAHCPYHDILALSTPAVSNPDGRPGGLFDEIGQEMAGPAASDDWLSPTGVWGEAFEDANVNARRDSDEPFTDDPANDSPTLGDAESSSGKWDGTFLAGFGGDRQAVGALDPITARVLVLKDTRSHFSMAWVSMDLLGYFSDFRRRIRNRLPEDLKVGHILLTHTHDHESPDTHVGLWGQDLTDDGTYPRYEIYVEAKIAQAITKAAKDLKPARFRFGMITSRRDFVTPSGATENLAGMQTRNSCRTPWFFDDELRAMQVVKDDSNRTIATLLNWGTHVESLEGGNTYVSSDFVHSARALVEKELGGVALYAPGAQGASEIIGDSCGRRWRRDTFDGESFPVDADGEPKALKDPYDTRGAQQRTYAIGRVLGSAALAALRGEPLDARDASLEFLKPVLLCFPVNNEGLGALAAAGVIDKPLVSPTCSTNGESAPDRAKTRLYAFRIGSGSFVTAPGELFPELYYGVSKVNRSKAEGDYVNASDEALACAGRSHHEEQPGAQTDRPFEPAIRKAQIKRFDARINFLIGYTPDLLGYIVPGYDWYWYGGPGGFGLPVEQAPDPCGDLAPDLAFSDAFYDTHYQETNSAGSMLAPAVACELARLLGDPFGQGDGPACMEWDFTNATGRPPDQPPPLGREPGCFTEPEPPSEACLIRHY